MSAMDFERAPPRNALSPSEAKCWIDACIAYASHHSLGLEGIDAPLDEMKRIVREQREEAEQWTRGRFGPGWLSGWRRPCTPDGTGR